MQKDKTSGKAMHHSSGGRKIPISAADRSAAKASEPRTRYETSEPVAHAVASARHRRSEPRLPK